MALSGRLLAGEPLRYEQLREVMDARTFESAGGKKLPYRLFVPRADAKGKLPLVLCMHGAGGRGDKNEMVLKDTVWALNTLATEDVQRDHPCFLVAPQCPRGAQWVDTPWGKGSYNTDDVPVSQNMAMVIPLLDSVMDEFADRVDPNRIYVVGFSMGGYATWDLITRNPDRFAAAVPVCGAGDPGKAKVIKQIPVWAFHGDSDGVVPPSGSEDMIEALKKAGAEPRYTRFPKTGHNSWTPAWKQAELVPWLFSCRKGG